jgi:hypothetical protein
MPGADVEAEAPTHRLSSPEWRAIVELPARTGPALALVIDRIVNPAGVAFELLVLPPENGRDRIDDSRVIARVTPFPPDRTGCFAVRIDPAVSRVALQLEQVGGGVLPESVEVRVTSLTDC